MCFSHRLPFWNSAASPCSKTASSPATSQLFRASSALLLEAFRFGLPSPVTCVRTGLHGSIHDPFQGHRVWSPFRFSEDPLPFDLTRLATDSIVFCRSSPRSAFRVTQGHDPSRRNGWNVPPFTACFHSEELLLTASEGAGSASSGPTFGYPEGFLGFPHWSEDLRFDLNYLLLPKN